NRLLQTGRRARPGRCRGGGTRFRLSRQSGTARGHSPHDRGRHAVSLLRGHFRAFIVAFFRCQGDFMDLKLAGKTALITGGSKGLGRATAEILAAEGCNVIIVSRTAETLAAVKSSIAQKS